MTQPYLRLWRDEWDVLRPNFEAHLPHRKDGPLAGLSLMLMSLPYDSLYSASVAAARAIGLATIPGMRVHGSGPGTTKWFDRNHWSALSAELAWIAGHRASGDPRVVIDIEAYGGSVPLWGAATTVEVEAVETAMKPFLRQLRALGVTPLVHPANSRYVPFRLIAERCPDLWHQHETWTYSPADYLAGGMAGVVVPMASEVGPERQWLSEHLPRATWHPAVRLEVFRNWHKQFRDDFAKMFGVPSFWSDVDKIGDWQQFGTPAWEQGATTNPLNDCRYAWVFPDPMKLGRCRVSLKQLDSRQFINGGDVGNSSPWPGQDGDGWLFSEKRFFGWNYTTLGGQPDLFTPPLTFVAELKPPIHDGERCVFSSWIDGGWRAYRLLHVIQAGSPFWRWEVCGADHKVVANQIPASLDWQMVRCSITPTTAFLEANGMWSSMPFLGTLEQNAAWFRIGASGKPSGDRHTWDGGRIKSFTAWGRDLATTPPGAYPWMA